MRITIIPEDKVVYVDGVSFSNLDLSSAPSNVHALQWKNDLGWIEFSEDENFIKPQNETINQLPEWANAAIASWTSAKEAFDEQQRNRANTANTQSTQ